MADINYQITFFSDWHCGSGLSSGSESDMLVKKDRFGLPIVPGRTIKGLLDEAACDLFETSADYKEFKKACFGSESEPEQEDKETDSVYHYSCACLSKAEINYLKGKPAEIRKLYRNIPSIRISDHTGVAEEKSLRTMQATIPLRLEGTLIGIPKDYLDKMKDCLLMIKRLGYKRNRGFGRCKFEVIEKKEGVLQ